MRRSFVAALVISLCVLGVNAPVASATVADGMPNQVSTDEGSSGQAGWSASTQGIAGRPYVQSLSVVNGSTTTPVVTDGTTATSDVPTGTVVAVVSPINLCQPGQTPDANHCYTSPNRISVTLGYMRADGLLGFDFAQMPADSPVMVNAETRIHVRIALNQFSPDLRWTGVNGYLDSWAPSGLGTSSAIVDATIAPVETPYVQMYPEGSGCSATPVFDCDIAAADDETLSASILFSVDDTLDSRLTGAAFATQHALFGYLTLGGSASAPTIDVQMASTHTTSDGTLQRGVLQAYLPGSAVFDIWGVPAELIGSASSFLTTTRTGSTGTNGAVTMRATSGASPFAVITVPDITFSTPTYRFKSAARKLTAVARQRVGMTRVSAVVPACAAGRGCTVRVYRVTRSARGVVKSTLVSTKRVRGRTVAVSLRSTVLKKGQRFAFAVARVTGGTALGAASGTVR